MSWFVLIADEDFLPTFPGCSDSQEKNVPKADSNCDQIVTTPILLKNWPLTPEFSRFIAFLLTNIFGRLKNWRFVFQKVAKKNFEVNNGKRPKKWNTKPMFQVSPLSYGKSDTIHRNSLFFLEFVILMKDRSQIGRSVVNIGKIWPKCDKILPKKFVTF